MKNIYPLFIGVLITTASFAQGKPDLKVESLKLNSAPAYVILGVEPDNIQRPSSPEQFIGGIQNSIVNGKLKPNVAMEITPFYLAKPENDKSSRFNVYQYLLNEDNSFGSIIKKSFSISFATSESDTVVFGKLKPGTGVGLGIRCTLIDTKPDNAIVNNLKKWMESSIRKNLYDLIELAGLEPTSQKELLDSIISITETFKSRALSNTDFNGLPYSYASQIADTLSEGLIRRITDNTISFKKMDILNTYLADQGQKEFLLQTLYLSKINGKVVPLTKQGFMLEFGAGYASVLQDNQFNGWESAKVGLWLTPSWRWNTSKDDKNISLFDFMGVVRYTINNKKDSIDVADYLDAGIKGQFTQNKWSGSLEFISRWASELPVATKSKYTYRLALAVDYKISDALTFKFTFGSNFDGNTSTYTKPKEMFAIGGLNLGIFNPKGNSKDN